MILQRFLVLIALLCVGAGCASKPASADRSPTNDGNLKGYASLFRSHAVALHWKNEFFCSGLRISSDKILTAAHCLRTFLNVTQKYFDQNFDLRIEGQSIKVGRPLVFSSKDFDFKELRSKNNSGDIAIIRIHPGTEASQFIFPLLNEFTPQAEDRYVTAGFGPNPDFNEIEPKKPNVELRVTQLQPEPENLRPELRSFKNGPVGRGMICGGDSGSPLFLIRDQKIFLIGVLASSLTADETLKGQSSQTTEPQNQNLFRRFQCANDVGTSFWTKIEDYFDLIRDPEHHGKQIKFRK